MSMTRRLVILSIFSALAIIFSYVESFVPVPFPVPGLKFGFSNVMVLSTMLLIDFRAGLTVAALKSLLSVLLLGRWSGLLYSFPATMFSALLSGFFIFCVNRNQEIVSEIGISICSSILFNITQLTMASYVVSDREIFRLLPYMILLSVATGLVIGRISRWMVSFSKKNQLLR